MTEARTQSESLSIKAPRVFLLVIPCGTWGLFYCTSVSSTFNHATGERRVPLPANALSLREKEQPGTCVPRHLSPLSCHETYQILLNGTMHKPAK